MAHIQNPETEPLLGRPGDATQQLDKGILANLWIGTAPLAQGGIWILAAIVWAAIFDKELNLFAVHPLLNSAGFLFTTQAILILQPTATPSQKQIGTSFHAALHSVGTLALLAGLIVIEYNKVDHGGAHFQAVHNYLGVTFYGVIGAQALVGVTQYYTPSLYGGEANAKSIWKYHRAGGYVALLLGLATICSAVETSWNKGNGHIKLWSVVVASVLVALGVLPRIKLAKLGF